MGNRISVFYPLALFCAGLSLAAAQPARIHVDVEEGLNPGDRVVVEGVIRVHPGQRVQLAEAQDRDTVGAHVSHDRRQAGENLQ